MSHPSALILDVEGVLAHPDLVRADKELGALVPGLSWESLDEARNGHGRYADWVVYSVGLLEGMDYWRRVLESAGATTDDTLVAALREVMRRVWWARLDGAVLSAADAARRGGVLVGLLSNSAPEHDGVIPVLEAHADAAHFSHRTGRRKPDAGAYTMIAEDLGVATQDCVFVDDKARNVDAARAVGMTAFRFTGAATLAARLATEGVLPTPESAEDPLGGDVSGSREGAPAVRR